MSLKLPDVQVRIRLLYFENVPPARILFRHEQENASPSSCSDRTWRRHPAGMRYGQRLAGCLRWSKRDFNDSPIRLPRL